MDLRHPDGGTRVRDAGLAVDIFRRPARGLPGEEIVARILLGIGAGRAGPTVRWSGGVGGFASSIPPSAAQWAENLEPLL